MVKVICELGEMWEQCCKIVFNPGSQWIEREKGAITFAPDGKFNLDGSAGGQNDSQFEASDGVAPHLGPAVLREAYLLLKAQALYQLVYVCLTRGAATLVNQDGVKNPIPQISHDAVAEWYERLRQAHFDKCVAKREQSQNKIEEWDDRFDFKFDKNGDGKSVKFLQPGLPVEFKHFISAHKYVACSHAPSIGVKVTWASGKLCVSGKLWHTFEELLEDIEDELLRDLMANFGSTAISRELAQDYVQKALKWTDNYDLLEWFEKMVPTVDDMFDQVFYHMNTSNLHHFSQTKSAVRAKTQDYTFENMRESFKQDILTGKWVEKDGGELAFVWDPSSKMGRASSMGLLFKEHRHLASLYILLKAPFEIRRDWAAMYRTFVLMDRTKDDGDENSKATQKQDEKKSQVTKNLAGVLGNDEREEDEITNASEIMYINAIDPDNEKQRLISTGKPTPEQCTDKNRGFILLDRHSEFVQDLDPEQKDEDNKQRGHELEQDKTPCGDAPEPYAKKVNLFLLDTMLVATSEHHVNFSATCHTKVEVESNASLEDKASTDTDTDASVGKVDNSVPLTVAEASVLMPNQNNQESFTLSKFDSQENPNVLKVTGNRFVDGKRSKRCYYFATFFQEDHNQLVTVLETLKDKRKIEEVEDFDDCAKISLNPMVGSPRAARGEDDVNTDVEQL
jgi:hypothetical protein